MDILDGMKQSKTTGCGTSTLGGFVGIFLKNSFVYTLFTKTDILGTIYFWMLAYFRRERLKIGQIWQIVQGLLNIWTEYSNCQIHSRGDSKTIAGLLISNIFLIFSGNYYSMHMKSEGMTLFDIFICLCRKFTELRALLFLSFTETSQNLKFIQKCYVLAA